MRRSHRCVGRRIFFRLSRESGTPCAYIYNETPNLFALPKCIDRRSPLRASAAYIYIVYYSVAAGNLTLNERSAGSDCRRERQIHEFVDAVRRGQTKRSKSDRCVPIILPSSEKFDTVAGRQLEARTNESE